MPKKDGIQFLNHFRTLDFNTPVLMLPADNQIEKKKASYAKGCDDYLVKPFEPSELVLRIKKLLNPRFNKNISSKKVFFGDFEYDLKLKVLSKNNISISLTSTETLIIEYLTQNLNKEISREKISNLLGDGINLRSVDVTITRLRKKLISDHDHSFLRTIRGKGYMLVSEYD